jgi:hypothetical protein
MNILIALRMPIPMIPLGILKKVEFNDGLLPVFLAADTDMDYMSLKRCTKICTNNVRLRYGWASVTLRPGS